MMNTRLSPTAYPIRVGWLNKLFRLVGLIILIGISPALAVSSASPNQSPITNYQLPITNYQSPITSTCSLITDNCLLVSPTGPYTAITAALAAAKDGDTIEVRGGTYAETLVVEKSVTLEGVDWPVIDGGDTGTVVTLAAPNIIFRGFDVRGSGVEPDRDHAGITLLNAKNILVENNRLSDVLFGVFVSQADDAIVRGNDITSKAQYAEGRKGDGVRLWYSRRVTIENNRLHEVRDAIAWYSDDLILRDNTIERGRYGIHLMYSHNATIERNRVLDNSVGLYVMYSNNVTLRDNLIRGQRGPSGYALGFKDVDNATVTGNALIDNRSGAFIDGLPFSPQGFGQFENNLIAFNDVGIILLQSARNNEFTGNTFWENIQQVAFQGGGNSATQNLWQGNYWSDYAGFDANGDGLGDTPYRAERLFENLTDREPLLRALIYSPAAQAVEFAGAAFPIVRPQPKVIDLAPLAQPPALSPIATASRGPQGNLTPAVLALLGGSLLCGAFAFIRGGNFMPIATRRGVQLNAPTNAPTPNASSPTVRVAAISKRYDKMTALSEVTFEVQNGDALALWGANGAGKTTLLKALLGLIDFEGAIHIAGHDVKRAGKVARRHIGYVPQETIFYDISVQATMEFYARLKHVTSDRIPVLLQRLGLSDHARKPVPALSGGLKQRLALALALLADPPVLLLDEPTASLDAQAQRDYLALLHSLRADEGKTIIFASHRLEEVEALANRVLVLEGGRVVGVLHPMDLLTKLMPEIQLTLWVAESQRPAALSCFTRAGLPAHLNGRGTVVVRVRSEEKMNALKLLGECGIAVENFEVERK